MYSLSVREPTFAGCMMRNCYSVRIEPWFMVGAHDSGRTELMSHFVTPKGLLAFFSSFSSVVRVSALACHLQHLGLRTLLHSRRLRVWGKRLRST